MGKSVTFNVDKLIKKLDLIEKVHIPKAAEQALRSFGFDVRELLQQEMQREYESPSAYTLRSPYFKQNGLTLTVGISDKASSGLSAAQYLAPTDKSQGRFRKPAAPTALDGAMLARYGIKDIAVPVESSRAGSQFLSAKGGLRSRKVQYLLDQLANPGSGRENYFVIKPGSGSRLTAGIYRRYRVKSEISVAFVFAKQQQTAKLDYHGVIRKAAEERLPRLIQSKLSRLLS
ncbi:MAG: hypothetical protein ED554_11805 [Synechococcus sp. YX04-3]|nr:MAG: hypothetical protein ED554_11805 [Synechococcus sp. YX04-3]